MVVQKNESVVSIKFLVNFQGNQSKYKLRTFFDKLSNFQGVFVLRFFCPEHFDLRHFGPGHFGSGQSGTGHSYPEDFGLKNFVPDHFFQTIFSFNIFSWPFSSLFYNLFEYLFFLGFLIFFIFLFRYQNYHILNLNMNVSNCKLKHKYCTKEEVSFHLLQFPSLGLSSKCIIFIIILHLFW